MGQQEFFPYQVLPRLSDDEYDSLRSSILEQGVLVPVEYDEEGNILDGHHRVEIATEFGIDYPKIVREGFSEQQKRSHARTLNTVRRHLSRVQKRAVIAEEILENPTDSNNQIAKRLGVSDTTVGAVREVLGPDAQPKWRQGADGKFYPATNANKQDFQDDTFRFGESEPSTVSGSHTNFLDDFFVSDEEIDEEIASQAIVETEDFKVVKDDREQMFPQNWVFNYDQREIVFEAIKLAKREAEISLGAEALAYICNLFVETHG